MAARVHRRSAHRLRLRFRLASCLFSCEGRRGTGATGGASCCACSPRGSRPVLR